jgi:hypothetical protein
VPFIAKNLEVLKEPDVQIIPNSQQRRKKAKRRLTLFNPHAVPWKRCGAARVDVFQA